MNILGMVAGLIVASGFIPQILRGYRTKHLGDLSYFMMAFLALGMVLWIGYGVLINSFPVIAANIIGAGCNITLIIMKYMYSK